MIIVPHPELFPWPWEEDLTPSPDQLIQENSCPTIQLYLVPMFACTLSNMITIKEKIEHDNGMKADRQRNERQTGQDNLGFIS